MAATADREARRTEGKLKSYPVAGSTTIFKGTLVGLNSSGYLVPMSDTAGLLFAGVAFEKVVNSGANGDLSCRVCRDGEFEFKYAGGDATQARVGELAYAVDDETVDEDAGLTTNDYPVGEIVEVVSASRVRILIAPHLRIAGTVATGDLATGAVTPDRMSTNAKTFVHVHEVDPGAAGGDLTDVPVFVAPAGGATLTKVGIVPKDTAAGIDNSNTCVVDVEDAAGNVIVTKTYNTGTAPPAANAYESLGSLDATHAVLTANEVVVVDVTQGSTADLGPFLVVIEWQPAA